MDQKSAFENPEMMEAMMNQAMIRARMQAAGEAPGGAPPVMAAPAAAAPVVQVNASTPIPQGMPDPELWNWDALPRDDAVRQLSGHPEGTFLVRASASAANAYSISVVQQGQVRHIRINNMPGGFAINKDDVPCATLSDLVAQKTGEKLKSTLQGSSGNSTESQLLVTPLPNPGRLAAFQAQMAQYGGPVAAPASPPGGFGLAAPPKANRAAVNDPYARQRGAAGGAVAATSQIQQPNQAMVGQSRALQQPPTAAAGADPFAPAAAAAAPAAAAGADPFAPAAPAAAPAAAPPAPTMSFLEMLQKVWTSAGPTDGKLGGAQLRPIMMMSGLPNDKLGTIWQMVDDKHEGTMDYKQLGFLLGLIGQQQRGEELSIASVGPQSVPPVLEGL